MTDYFSEGIARHPTWHGKENMIGEDMPSDWREAFPLAGLIDPVEQPIWLPALPTLGVDEDPAPVRLAEGHRALVHPTTGEIMSTQADSYHMIPVSVIGEMIDVMRGAAGDNTLEFDTVGSLHDHKQIFATMVLNEPFKIDNDPSLHLSFIVFTNSYDGTLPLGVRKTHVRVVCANTEAYSREQAERGNGFYLTFKHTKNWKFRVEDAQQVLSSTRDSQTEYIEWAESMMLRTITPQQEQVFITMLIGADKINPAEVSTRTANNIESDRETVMEILNSATMEGIRGNTYGLVQAGNEFLEHHARYRKMDAVIKRSLVGDKKRTTKIEELALVAANA